MEQIPTISTEQEQDDIIIKQESIEPILSDLSNINSGNPSSLSPDKITLESCLFNNGIFLPQDKFIGEIYFKNDALKYIEAYMEDIILTAFKEENLNFIVINSSFFRKNTEYRRMIHNCIDERHSDYKSVSVGNKDYIMICKKNKFLEFIQSVPKDKMQIALDLIFIKLFSFNMKEFNQNNIDQKELEELYNENEEDLENVTYEELQNKKRERLKEIADEEEKSKQISLPVFKKCQVVDIRETSVKIILPFIKIESIIEKNRSNIRGFKRLYENTKIEYVAYLYDGNHKEFIEYVISENPSFSINNLKTNSAYLIKFSMKFDKYYSRPSKTFIFFTRREENIDSSSVTSYIAWGNNKNNCLLVNSDYLDNHPEKYLEINASSRISNEDSINTVTKKLTQSGIKAEDDNNNNILNLPSRLNNNKVIDYSRYWDVTYLLLSTGEVVSSGKTFVKSSEDSQDINFEFDESKAGICRLYYANPYTVSFPWGVNIRKIGCGFDFCVCLDLDGQLYSWGINDFGQLGQNLPKDVVINTPKKINIKYENYEDNVFVTDIQVGSKHCLASIYVNEKIKLFSWGFGQGCEPIIKPEEYAVKGIKLDERLFKISNSFTPLVVKFSNTDKIVKIMAAFNQNAIICREKYLDNQSIDVVYTFGETSNFQLGYLHNFLGSVHYWGIPTRVDFFVENGLSILDISYSDNHTLFLVKNLSINIDEVYCCGINSNSKCGQKEKEIAIPKKIRLDVTDNNLHLNPIKISAGKNHSLILCDDMSLLLVGKTDIFGNKTDKNIITSIENLKMKSTDKVLKIDCMDDNITILVKHK